MPSKNELQLSNILTAMGKSVDEAVEQMHRENIACDLEEFECTLELDATPNLSAHKTSKQGSNTQLTFFESTKKSFSRPTSTSTSTKNTFTIRAVFSPMKK